MNEIDFVVEKLKAGEIFFFAGSGISYASNLPSAYTVLEHTANAFLPSNISKDEKRSICKNIQPEVFYESIIGMTRSYDYLDIWRSLYKGVQQNHQVQCEPNFTHLFIVEYSRKNGLPIITTNFDSMFEQACDLLDIKYRILLPADSPSIIKEANALYICKIHGSIQDNQGEYSPETLSTTMTQITRVNTIWIEYLKQLMSQKYLCFVGYSGRDIDLFPYIANISQSTGAKKIIWINRFEGDHSDEASRSCAAMRVCEWPGRLFESKLNELTDWRPPQMEQSINDSGKIEALLNSLEKCLAEKNLLTDVEKELLYCDLIAKLGNYGEAYKLATEMEKTKLSMFSRHSSKHLLLLTCARLCHETSRYVSCQKYARQVLALLRNKDEYNIDVALQASCLLSEAHRMSIPNDIYFSQPKKLGDYFHVAFVVAHFIFSIILEKMRMHYRKKHYSGLSTDTQHELIEHRIRFYALIQSILGSHKRDWSRLAKVFLLRRWDSIRDKSYRVGYSAGIANAGKYRYRLIPLEETKSESANIYAITTSATGSQLLLRNEADQLLRNNKFEESRGKFIEYYNMAKKSGNALNEVKGLIGYAYANHMEGMTPLLTDHFKERFNILTNAIEGKRWRDHFLYIKTKYMPNE